MPKIVTTPLLVPRRLRALHFDNASFEHYDLGDIAAPGKFHADDDWTVCGIFKLGTSTADQRAVVSKWGSGGSTRQFLMAADNSTTAGLDISFANGTLFTGAQILRRGQWYCGIVSHIGGTSVFRKRVYDLTGRLLEEQTATDTSELTGSETEEVRIGIKQTNADEFDGDIGFAGYFGKTIPPNELHKLAVIPLEMVRRYWAECLWAFELTLNPVNLGSWDISIAVTNSPTLALGPMVKDPADFPVFLPGAAPPSTTSIYPHLVNVGVYG